MFRMIINMNDYLIAISPFYNHYFDSFFFLLLIMLIIYLYKLENSKKYSKSLSYQFSNNSPKPPKKPKKTLWEKFKKHIYSFFLHYIFGFIFIGIILYINWPDTPTLVVDHTELYQKILKLLFKENTLPISFRAYILSIYGSNDFYYFEKFIETTALDRRSLNIKTQFLIEVIAMYNEKYNLSQDPERTKLFIQMLLKYCNKYQLNYTHDDLLAILRGLHHFAGYVYYKSFAK